MSRHTIGTDPEFFVKRESDGKFLNAETMFPGTKDEPHLMVSGAGLQTDNVAVEFASPVGKDGEDLVIKLRETFHELFKMIPEEMVLDTTPSVEFDDDQLQTEQAQRFGCDPSFCAWELMENEQPNAESSRLRSTGGHVHIGTTGDDNNEFLYDPHGKIHTVRACDALLGIVGVVLDNSAASIERRKLYGKAGEHRPTEYGVEYRTLSSFWLKSPNLVMMVDSMVADVLDIVREEKHEDLITELGGGEVIQTIINTGDVKAADKLVRNVLEKHMSKDSKYFFAECYKTIGKISFTKEWAIGA